jgi:hypothetical protein
MAGMNRIERQRKLRHYNYETNITVELQSHHYDGIYNT